MFTIRFGRFARRVAACVALGSLLIPTACSQQPPPPAPIPSVDAHWSETWLGNPAAGKGTPGIDHAKIHWWKWNDHLALAVWLDRGEGGGSVGAGGIGKPGVYEGEFHVRLSGAKDLADIDIKCESTDGTTGPIRVNGETLDLVQGSLLLVARSGDKLRTKLLNRHNLPVPDEKGDPKLFEKLKADPEVVAFFDPKKTP